MVEIAKALSINSRLVILDEPTSSLPLAETEKLLEVIAGLKAHGIAVIFISHRLHEVVRACDRVVVLRDGRMVGTLEGDAITHDAMVKLMVGRDLKVAYAPPAARAGRRRRCRDARRADRDLSPSRASASTSAAAKSSASPASSAPAAPSSRACCSASIAPMAARSGSMAGRCASRARPMR